MVTKDERRHLMGAFLRARREGIAPADAGLAVGVRRRRTPGLRREEVAQLAGLSPAWYTWIEQGRDVSVSPGALARVADALQLTRPERAYLFELAEKRDPRLSHDARGADSPPAQLADAIAAINVPAYLLDRTWCACAWNDPAEALFAAWLGGPQRNQLRYVFLDPDARTFICDWGDRARRLLAEFRADTSRYGDDHDVVSLIRELQAGSAEFDRFWNDQRVLEREGGTRIFNHPRHGKVCYEQLTLRPSLPTAYKLVMLLPSPARASDVG